MTRLAWLTDPHFDHCEQSEYLIENISKKANDAQVDALILSGDISSSKKLVYHLSVLERTFQKPIYFVLGNHDYWGSDIETVRKTVLSTAGYSSYLKFLTRSSYVALSKSTCVLGHDGWYDAYLGNAMSSQMGLNDWDRIYDFIKTFGRQTREETIKVSRELASQSLSHIKECIKAAAKYHNNIVIVTHVPPFIEACRYGAEPTQFDALPWFCNAQLGNLLRVAGDSYKNINFTIFAGHTHFKGEHHIAKNIHCYVGASTYGKPDIQEIVNLND